jgi:glycosyltransferase involved in cell wall biosynthesis
MRSNLQSNPEFIEMQKTILAIDASNLLDGGGKTHLKEILKIFNNREDINCKVLIGSNNSLNTREYKNIEFINIRQFDENILKRHYWHLFHSNRYLKSINTDILFIPGGIYIGHFKPFVTMSRNMLIFERNERARYGFSKTRLRLKLLETISAFSFKRAQGIIFISNFAKSYINNVLELKAPQTIIHHGVSKIFNSPASIQKNINTYSIKNPFKFLYVSIIDLYKHQWNVIKAIDQLRKKGYPITIDLVGPAYKPALKKYNEALESIENHEQFINYQGKKSYNKLADTYSRSNAIIFASTCENMPNILLEGMSSGKPIACSDKQPMPEFLKEGGYYFDALDVNSISDSLELLLLNENLRTNNIAVSKRIASEFNWEKCADETINFLLFSVNNYNRLKITTI